LLRSRAPLRLMLLALLLAAPGLAPALERLPDAALSKVAGRDGMSFNLAGFAASGTASLRYYTGDGSGSFAVSNLSASRSDNPDAPFADPYRLDVVKGGAGRADIVTLLRPANAAGRELWQLAWDLDVSANGRAVNVGSVIVKDLAYYGGGLQWSTPAAGDGLAFGYSLSSSIGSLSLLPNGRLDASEALVLSNLRIGAAGADGSVSGPWRIADVTSQAGIFNARTDEAGNARLHIGIDWPDANGAAIGSLQVGNITFRSPAAAPVDLGSSRIGAIQLQYLDVKFRP
jgi:hypothetical protein